MRDDPREPDRRFVALLAEGVDRNTFLRFGQCSGVVVALLAEGVDRNCFGLAVVCYCAGSPSSRRAWIEMYG